MTAPWDLRPIPKPDRGSKWKVDGYRYIFNGVDYILWDATDAGRIGIAIPWKPMDRDILVPDLDT